MSGPVERLDTTLSVTPGNSSATCFHARPRVARSWGAQRRAPERSLCTLRCRWAPMPRRQELVRRNRRGRGAGAGRFTGGSATPPRSTPAWPRRRTHGGRPPCPAPAPTWRPSSRANVAAVSPPNAKVAPPADPFPRTTSRSPRPWPASGATRPARVIPPQEGRDDRRYPAANLTPIRGDVRSLHNRAVLLVGFAWALRRSELAGIRVEQLEQTKRGLRLTLPPTKRSQAAAVMVPCPTEKLSRVRCVPSSPGWTQR
jgi:hypothetical protein